MLEQKYPDKTLRRRRKLKWGGGGDKSLEEHSVKLWTEFNRLRVVSMAAFCKYDNEHSGSLQLSNF